MQSGLCRLLLHPTAITPRLGTLTGGVAAPNGGPSTSNNMALPAVVSLLLASNIEMGNRHISVWHSGSVVECTLKSCVLTTNTHGGQQLKIMALHIWA